MSATHTQSPSTWQPGHQSSRPVRAAKGALTRTAGSATDHRPPLWLVCLGQLAITVVATLVTLPLMVLSIFIALVASAWMLLLPALMAGLVIALVSLVLG